MQAGTHSKPYSSITIIYNPNSTGAGKELAKALAERLRNELPKQEVHVSPTKHAGHAEELAYTHAKRGGKRPLVISSSGDGGYHEIISGVMRARAEGVDAVSGLLPAGNANDHYHQFHPQRNSKRRNDIVNDIIRRKEHVIDLLKLEYELDGNVQVFYAHSYMGVGLTPKAGRELNRAELNRFREFWIIAKVLLFLQPVTLIINGKARAYDSIIFSNIGKMSKILTISDRSKIDDGKFEVSVFRRRSRLKLIAKLLTASTRGLKGTRQTDSFYFTTAKEALMQLDGEIMTLTAGSQVHVCIEHQALRCVI